MDIPRPSVRQVRWFPDRRWAAAYLVWPLSVPGLAVLAGRPGWASYAAIGLVLLVPIPIRVLVAAVDLEHGARTDPRWMWRAMLWLHLGCSVPEALSVLRHGEEPSEGEHVRRDRHDRVSPGSADADRSPSFPAADAVRS